MDLQSYLRVLRGYWRSIVTLSLLGIILAGAVSLVQDPSYSGSASIFVAVESGGSAGELSQGASYAEQQVQSYARVATTSVVLQPVIDRLGLDETSGDLAERLSVSPHTGTSIIQVTAEDDDADEAAVLANSVAASLTAVIENLSPAGPSGDRLVKATVIEPAIAPDTPTSPRPLLYLILGALLGVLAGVGQAFLRSVLDTRVRNVADLAEITDVPLLGSVGRGDGRDGHVQAWANAEAYRRLRTNVGFTGLGGERKPSIVITSALSGEGKTQTAVNLAKVLAQAGESVLLIDADLRRPMAATRLDVDGAFGLSDVLTSRIDLSDALLRIGDDTLDLLPAGTIPPNPSELLGSTRMATLLEWAEEHYDHVVLDSPPVLPVTDATVLAATTGGVILVARHGVVTRPELSNALDLLEAGSARVLGVVLNDMPATTSGSYQSYYSSKNSPTNSVSSGQRAPLQESDDDSTSLEAAEEMANHLRRDAPASR